MPIYEYECVDKGHRFEVIQKMSDDPIAFCQVCGGKVRKLISAAGFTLKGSGWYKDGYSSVKPSSTSTENSTSSSASSTNNNNINKENKS